MLNHLKHHWHHHLTVASMVALILSFIAGAGAASLLRHGGYKKGPLPPVLAIAGGKPLPVRWNLARHIVRVHNQGASNSCVGQTLATIMEITHREHYRRRLAFSSGFIWNQASGYQDAGVSYGDAFSLLQTEGDAPLIVFPPDGADRYWTRPDENALLQAHHHRIRTWRSISPADRHTIEFELHAGRPIAIAIPVTDSFYGNYGRWKVIDRQYGRLYFWHSITGIGYGPHGVRILNSWGPTWGRNGEAMLSWSFLSQVNAAVVVSSPRYKRGVGRHTSPGAVPPYQTAPHGRNA
ncbi:MAG: C1 family peptidase [Chloroflexota bacterium]